MKCPECALVRKMLGEMRTRFKDYPKWYQEGGQCPGCGAGFVGEFGTREVPDTAADLKEEKR